MNLRILIVLLIAVAGCRPSPGPSGRGKPPTDPGGQMLDSMVGKEIVSMRRINGSNDYGDIEMIISDGASIRTIIFRSYKHRLRVIDAGQAACNGETP